jgi:hypothetical protein
MISSPSPRLVGAYVWQLLKGIGCEKVELLKDIDRWMLRGTIVRFGESGPAEVRYEIVCDTGWHTTRADINIRDSKGDRTLQMTNENGHWYENGQHLAAFDGCIDVDLEWSPSTNTLPIRRLNLAVGESSGMLTAAWVRFPDLTIQTLQQEYERIGELKYRYSSQGGFKTEIVVDDEGLVITYGGFWERANIRT